MQYGTLMTFDTLQSQAVANSTIAEIGEDRVFAAIDAELTTHNEQYLELLRDYVEVSQDRLRRYGGNASMQMEQLDEVGATQAQKISAGVTVGFPLYLYAIAVQWTRKFMENATAAELTEQFTAAQDADLVNLINIIRTTLFTPTNKTFTDKLVDGVALPVKALLNADGAPIPNGPNQEVFNPATHTHYLFTASTAPTAAEVAALIDTVVEHRNEGQMYLYINRAQEATMRGFTSAPNMFVAYSDPRLAQPVTAVRAEGEPLNQQEINNRAIGIFNQAEVWVKPWVPPGYMLAWRLGGPKTLVMRRRNANAGNLRIAAEYDTYPLRARALEREVGMGVWNRDTAAILYVDSGAAGAYVAPTF